MCHARIKLSVISGLGGLSLGDHGRSQSRGFDTHIIGQIIMSGLEVSIKRKNKQRIMKRVEFMILDNFTVKE